MAYTIGKHKGIEIEHISVSSSIKIKKTYYEEVEQGIVKEVTSIMIMNNLKIYVKQLPKFKKNI